MSSSPSLNSPATDTSSKPTRTSSKEAMTESPLTPIEARRLQALLEQFPSLPAPIANAMVKRAGQGPVGSALTRLEEALGQLNELPDLRELSGSEVRVLDVTLRQIGDRVAELRNSLNRVWSSGA